MAPTLGLREVADVSAEVATTENSQALQMSGANGGNRDALRVSAPHEQQTEHDVVSHSHENLQASGEEQRLADTTQRRTNTTQAHQANAVPEPVTGESPNTLIVSALLHQEEQNAMLKEEIMQANAQVSLMMTANTEMVANHKKMVANQEKMRAQSQASSVALRAQMQAFLNLSSQIQDGQRKSSEQVQKTSDDVEEMKEVMKKRDEQAQKTLEELEKMKEEFSMKVDETVRKKLREAVDEELKKLPKVIKKEIKKEAKREKNKEEKAAGKPKKPLSLYNIHVMEEKKRLIASGSGEDLFLVASISWKEMDEEERWERYGGIYQLDKERYERELEIWWEKREVPVDQRKPAAKPTTEGLDATTDPRQSVADDPNATSSPPEESAPTAAAMGPGNNDEGYQLSEYEQQVQDKIARNENHLRSLGLLPGSTTGVETENDGFLSRSGASNSKSKRGKKNRRNNQRGRGLGEGSLGSIGRRRNTHESTTDPVVNLDVQGSTNSAASNEEGGNVRKSSFEDSVAAATAEDRPQTVADSLAGATNTQEEYARMPGLTAPNEAEATLASKEVAAPPPTMTTGAIHRRQEGQGDVIALAEERTSGTSADTFPETAPFLGEERNSEEDPPHVEETRQSRSVPTVVNNHRDNTDGAVGSAAASNGDGNAQESSSVTTRRQRGKKRKNDSPYWYKNFPVYELEDYTDGTPLPPGYVWVEYSSGVVVKVKEIELGKKLTARNPRRKLKHDLFSARTTSREAGGSSGNLSEVQTTTVPETIYVDSLRRSENAAEMPFPVGYRFYHYVSGGSYHAGYKCVAEVKEVIGDDDGEFTSPNSVRRCYYFDVNDGSKRGEGNPLVKTIEKRKAYKN